MIRGNWVGVHSVAIFATPRPWCVGCVSPPSISIIFYVSSSAWVQSVIRATPSVTPLSHRQCYRFILPPLPYAVAGAPPGRYSCYYYAYVLFREAPGPDAADDDAVLNLHLGLMALSLRVVKVCIKKLLKEYCSYRVQYFAAVILILIFYVEESRYLKGRIKVSVLLTLQMLNDWEKRYFKWQY